ncbi:MAG TPA: 5-(carboxyamino)imidazole ribonucleotide synthase [Rhizomicrobium sp.]|jgi:5-(carboxyamino)imidazole ribonucleotide synthase|nr:5-(carboxyamino)imidazole ribonucleotide synthase [Rhizomicrobium sp.]
MTVAASPFPVAPGGTIGILGGGQLGRMLSLAAARLGLKTHIYSDQPHAPAFDVAAARTHAAYRLEASLAAFAQDVDVITFEFENVPSETVEFLANLKPTHPDARALAVTQDRLAEKNFLGRLGIATTRYAGAGNSAEARAALAEIGTPAILKTRRFGYDGKGQVHIANDNELGSAFENIRHAPAILEHLVDFTCECSLVAARSADGSFAAYDPPENVHREQILRRSQVPSRLTPAQCAEVTAIARTIADALAYVGVLTVEFFVTKDGGLLVNEIAPRVHNSGHWTLEACAVSQFEQHIRAVAGWPLGDPSRHCDAEMVNLIGAEAEDWKLLSAQPVALHLYGKQEIRPGRKMGHFTRLSPLSDRPGGAAGD